MNQLNKNRIYIYHIKGKKIGQSVNGKARVHDQLDSDEHKWEIVETIPANTLTIDQIVSKESEWSKVLGYSPDHAGQMKFVSYLHKRWDHDYDPPLQGDVTSYYVNRGRPVWFDGYIYSSKADCSLHTGYSASYLQNLLNKGSPRIHYLPRWQNLPLVFKGVLYSSIKQCAYKCHHTEKHIWKLVTSGEVEKTFIYPVCCPMIQFACNQGF